MHQPDEFLKGKLPRRLMYIAAVVLAIAIGFTAVVAFNHRLIKQQEEATKQRQKAASEAVASPAAPIDAVGRAVRAAKDSKPAVPSDQGANGTKADTNRPTMTAADFEKGNAGGGRGAYGQAASGDTAEAAREQSEVSLYASPIFKGGQQSASQRIVEGGTQSGNPALDSLTAIAKNLSSEKPNSEVASVAAALGKQTQAPTERNQQFLDAEQKVDSSTDKVTFSGTLPKCTVAQGSVIETTLIEGIDSDMPGEFRGVVSRDVYDTTTGDCLVIPKGSIFYGRYSSDIRIGQERLLAAMETLRLPNGKVVSMQGAPVADVDGYAGLDGDVNNHFFKIFGAALVVGVLERAFDNGSTATTTTPTGTTTYGDTAGQVFANTAQVILDRNRDIPPTITRPRASTFLVRASRNIELEPYVQ